MQSIDEALKLLKRQAQLEHAMKQPGGIRITQEQELHAVRRRLTDLPEAIKSIEQAAAALRRPVTELTASDVEQWGSAGRAA